MYAESCQADDHDANCGRRLTLPLHHSKVQRSLRSGLVMSRLLRAAKLQRQQRTDQNQWHRPVSRVQGMSPIVQILRARCELIANFGAEAGDSRVAAPKLLQISESPGTSWRL